jgi:hypothetical protein
MKLPSIFSWFPWKKYAKKPQDECSNIIDKYSITSTNHAITGASGLKLSHSVSTKSESELDSILADQIQLPGDGTQALISKNILDLPTELLQQIVANLPLANAAAFVLSCKMGRGMLGDTCLKKLEPRDLMIGKEFLERTARELAASLKYGTPIVGDRDLANSVPCYRSIVRRKEVLQLLKRDSPELVYRNSRLVLHRVSCILKDKAR